MKFEDIDKIVADDKPIISKQVINEQLDNNEPYKEPEPSRLNLNVLQNNLGNCLSIIDDEVMKGYVTKLEQFPIIKVNEGFEEGLNDIHFFKISELVYQEE